jgi:hypothetical protein
MGVVEFSIQNGRSGFNRTGNHLVNTREEIEDGFGMKITYP